jgi:hypothetical protein
MLIPGQRHILPAGIKKTVLDVDSIKKHAYIRAETLTSWRTVLVVDSIKKYTSGRDTYFLQ